MARSLCKVFLVQILVFSSLEAVTHPHMIVRESDYGLLQARAQNWPWSEMKRKAIVDAGTLNYRAGDSFIARCMRVHEIAGACALAYILDPDSRSTCLHKAETQLLPAMRDIRIEKGTKTGHEYNVTPAHAVFMTYLLLDILYNALAIEKRQAMEEDCDLIAGQHVHSWMESEYSIKGMRELYHNGKTALFVSYKNLYRDYVLSLTSDNGVYGTGPGYAYSRLFMDDRLQKKMFMDICEYQGYAEFYSNAKLRNLYEWIFGYLVTPFNRSYTFGDTPPTKDLDHWAVSALRAPRFSTLAGEYARWRLGALSDQAIKGRLLHFLLCDSVPQAASRPNSRIFANGGAWLLQDSDSSNALAGALWNIHTSGNSHNHFDVNAVHIAGYNAHLLRNSGYDGSGQPDPLTWTWINKTAESSNTLLLDSRNHMTKHGGGITESLLEGDWQYARGKSGNTLTVAQHFRNLFFLRPVPGKTHGYFMVTDEVQPFFSWSVPTKVNLIWHPNSAADPQRLLDVYRWPVQGCDYGGINVGVDLLPIVRPDSSEIRSGYLASYESCSRFLGKYLHATYSLHEGQANLGTIFFPADYRHTPATMTRLQPVDAGGAKVDHGQGRIDYIFLPAVNRTVAYGSVSLSGRTAIWREADKQIESYFLCSGTVFEQRGYERRGVAADKNITIHVSGDRGWLLSPGTQVTFYEANIAYLCIDGTIFPALDAGEHWVRVYVDSGKHSLQILRKPTRVLQGAADHPLPLRLYPNPSNSAVTISYALDQPGPVAIELLNIRGQSIADIRNGWQTAGLHEQVWQTGALASGVYLCRLRLNGQTVMKKLVVQK